MCSLNLGCHVNTLLTFGLFIRAVFEFASWVTVISAYGLLKTEHIHEPLKMGEVLFSVPPLLPPAISATVSSQSAPIDGTLNAQTCAEYRVQNHPGRPAPHIKPLSGSPTWDLHVVSTLQHYLNLQSVFPTLYFSLSCLRRGAGGAGAEGRRGWWVKSWWGRHGNHIGMALIGVCGGG